MRATLPGCLLSGTLFFLTSASLARQAQVFSFSGPEPRDLDPQLEIGAYELRAIRALFEGLVARDPKTAEPIPAVAASWVTSSDGKQWTFTLREDAKWSNGDPVTADDFVYSWTRLLAKETAALNAYLGYYLKNGRDVSRGLKAATQLGVRALSPRALLVELENPTPFFLELLDTPPFFPLHRTTLEKHGGLWTRTGNLVSNGAFALRHWQLGKVISLHPNPHYWDRKSVKLTEVKILANASLKTGENLFRAKQTDLLFQIPQENLDYWRKDKSGVLRSEPQLGLMFLALNLKRPPLDDKRVRHALSLALDREKLVKYVTRGNEEASGAFTVPLPGYRPVSKVPLDGSGIERAKALLQEAGFGPRKPFPRLTLRSTNNDNGKKVVEAIQEMWRKNLGIVVNLEAEESKVFINTLRTKDFDIAADGWAAQYSDPSTFLELWITDGGNNDSGFANEAYDRLLKEASAQTDREKRYDLFHRAEAILAEEMPAIPLRIGRRNYLLSPKVQGWHPNAQDVHPLKYLSIKASP